MRETSLKANNAAAELRPAKEGLSDGRSELHSAWPEDEGTEDEETFDGPPARAWLRFGGQEEIGTARLACFLPTLLLLAMSVVAHADDPPLPFEVTMVRAETDAVSSTANDCWDGAPPGATVLCGAMPEHGDVDVFISLKHATSTDVAIRLQSMDITATGGSDYVALNRAVTIPAGDTDAQFEIEGIDDRLVEGHETFYVVLSAPSGNDLVADYIHVTIIDEESIEFTVEGGESPEYDTRGPLIEVSFSEPVFWPFDMQIWNSDGTATAPDDYGSADETRTLNVFFERIKSFSFRNRIVDDTLDEPDEYFRLTILGLANVSPNEVSTTLTIIDDDDPPVLSMNNPRGLEDSVGSLDFVASLSAVSGKTITVDYATADLVAEEGSDYVGESGTLTFVPGEREATISVAVTSDNVDEPDEKLLVNLSGVVNATIGDAQAEGEIRDDDDFPLLSMNNPRGLEDSVGSLDFVASLSAVSGKTITVDYATLDLVAEEGSDYVGKSGTLTFVPGERKATISVDVTSDDIHESDETFHLWLTNPTNVQLPNTSVGTIQDDDPQLSITDATALESAGHLEFTVTATHLRKDGQVVMVDYETANATATAGSDYEFTSGTLTFTKDATSRVITVPILDDNADEPDENFLVELSGVVNATIGDGQAEGEIRDDDEPSSNIALTVDPPQVSEADGATEVTVTATLDVGALTEATTVTVSVAGSGEPDAVDFDPVDDFTITIAMGAMSGSATFTLEPIDDQLDELDETLSFTGTSDLDDLEVTGTTLDLEDDDATSKVIVLQTAPPRVQEDAGSTPVVVTALLDGGARTVETVVTVSVDGSGSPGVVGFEPVDDFTITIAMGATSGSATFTLEPMDDLVDEMDETLSFTGTSDLDVTETTMDLADDDSTSEGIVLQAVPPRVEEDAGSTPVVVTALLDAAARTVETVVAVSVDGSGSLGVVGFESVPTFTITIAAEATSGQGTFDLHPDNDNVDETDETLSVTGTSDLPVTATSVVLADDDPPATAVVLSAVPASVQEGQGTIPVVVTGTLDASARAVDTVVTVSVTGSGDADAVDYEDVSDFAITVAAGALSGTETFMLTPEPDNVAENNEVLDVTGTADLDVTATTVTIVDDDAASTAIALSAVPAVVSEGDGAVRVTVTASLNRAARQRATTVVVRVAGQGIANAVDFAAVPDFEITIPANAGSGSGEFTLRPEDDSTTEAEERLQVSGMADLPVSPASVRLIDDDEPARAVLLSVVPGRVSEGSGSTPVTVTATLDRGQRTVATTVRIGVSSSGGPDAVGFAPVPVFEITIPANTAKGTGTFTLTPEDDELDETDNTLRVSGTSDLSVVPTSLTLADDDEVSTRILLYLTVDPPRASEGDGAVRVTVTAAVDKGARPNETRIRVSVRGSGNRDVVGFEPIADFDIVIPAFRLDGAETFTVVPVDDLFVTNDEVLTISGASDLPVTAANLTLLDDDEAPSAILLTVDTPQVSENDGPTAVTVTATLNRGVLREETIVAVSVSGGGDPAAVDFAPVGDFEIAIPGSAASGTGMFTLTPEDDAEDEVDEMLSLTGVAVLPVTPASMVLVDDDEAFVPPDMSVADAEAVEADGSLAFVISLALPSPKEATVHYATADGTAQAGADYGAITGTLTFARATLAATIRVPVLDDLLDEPDETLALTLSDVRGATLARASATGTILDDDEPPVLAIAGAQSTETAGELAFAVTLGVRGLSEITVAYTSADGTARAGEDYEAVSGTLTFAPGETANTVRVPVIDDVLDESDETLSVTLSAAVAATIGTGEAQGTILDDDEPPEATVADAGGDETVGELAFVVSLSGPSGNEVSIDYATADGTAIAGDDYRAVSGTLAFPPGTISRTILVSVVDDAVNEADEETFTMALLRPQGAVLTDDEAVGTIRDDDLAPPMAAGGLPDAVLCVGGVPLELDLGDHFAGEELRFAAVSSAQEVAAVTVVGNRLMVAPVVEGRATVMVTAANDSGSVDGVIDVRVVADPAELLAVDAVLASIGGGVLAQVTESVADRVVLRGASPSPGTSAGRDAAWSQEPVTWNRVVPHHQPVSAAADWSRLTDRPQDPSTGNRRLPTSYGLAEWTAVPGRHAGGSVAPFEFSLDGSRSETHDAVDSGWTVWGRGDTRRFEAVVNGSSHQGALSGLHLGADVQFGDWLAGVSVLRSTAEADFGFERSVEACGGGEGTGFLQTELTSIHPYAGRQLDRGWIWATVGAGRGDVSVERCESGHTSEADLSMRLVALGGRHPLGNGERVAVSVLEDVGLVSMTTSVAPGPAGDRSATAGRARLGLEMAGVAPPDCDFSLTSYARAQVRGDWGDGVNGAGLELAAGVRLRNTQRRLGVDLGVSALAVHSEEDTAERSANLAFSILPRADGTGLHASLRWRQQAESSAWAGVPTESTLLGPGRDLERHWTAATRLGFGMATRRGIATPFLEIDTAGQWSKGGARLGVRHEFGQLDRGMQLEWLVERREGLAGARNRLVIEASARY